jgi:hypothetical protein
LQKEEYFKVIEEEWLEHDEEQGGVGIGDVISIYRYLRENYEFRLRYDEAGKFFIREMELKRNYREVLSPDGSKTIVKRNGWPRRNLSLTGLYYHFSTYGESIVKSVIIGAIIVGLSTFFWLIQNSPTAEYSCLPLSFILASSICLRPDSIGCCSLKCKKYLQLFNIL